MKENRCGLSLGLMLVFLSVPWAVVWLVPDPAPPSPPMAEPSIPVSVPEASPFTPQPAMVSQDAVVVVATLPDASGSVWPTLMQARKLAPRPRPTPEAGAPPAFDGLDTFGLVLNTMGMRPDAYAEKLAWASPDLAQMALEWQIEWHARAEMRSGGAQASLEGARAHRLSDAIIRYAPDSDAATRARTWSFHERVVGAEPEQREQQVWEAFVRHLQGEQVLMIQHHLKSSVSNPQVSLEDHGVIAALPGHGLIEINDLLLRDALRREDRAWTEYWWSKIQAAHAEGAIYGLPHERALALPSRDAMAGTVGAFLGRADSWEDGLRVAAVRCSKEHTVTAEVPLEHSNGWATELDGDPFAACVIARAEPLPPGPQPAILRVVSSVPASNR